ncbi:MAG: hypothetical protein ACOC2H_00175 [Spirochaetota bacterium]
MKTIDHLINKNVYYLGSNYEYFKHISRFFAIQRCKSIFISNKKEAISSIDRELGNMRAISYSYHVIFEDHQNYMKTITRILKNREEPDILLISFKADFEHDAEDGKNPMLEAGDEQINVLLNHYIANTVKTINRFADIYRKKGKGTIASIVTDSSSNPLENIFSGFINTYILSLNEQIIKEGHSGIQCKVFYKKSENISYERFVTKFAYLIASKKTVIRL